MYKQGTPVVMIDTLRTGKVVSDLPSRDSYVIEFKGQLELEVHHSSNILGPRDQLKVSSLKSVYIVNVVAEGETFTHKFQFPKYPTHDDMKELIKKVSLNHPSVNIEDFVVTVKRAYRPKIL